MLYTRMVRPVQYPLPLAWQTEASPTPTLNATMTAYTLGKALASAKCTITALHTKFIGISSRVATVEDVRPGPSVQRFHVDSGRGQYPQRSRKSLRYLAALREAPPQRL